LKATATEAAIRVEDVRKRFGGVQAVDGLSFHVAPGEVFGLLGPNGAGKSTTIGMICGLIRPDEGFVEIGGGSPGAAGVRTALGVAPQPLAIYEALTARENLHFFGKLYGLRARERSERARELLDFVGLTERGGDRAGGFSGGMKRRLNLACAMMHDPRILLLDEPTAGVDPQSRNSLFEAVERLRNEGRAVIYTTHYMEEAQRLCDRVGVIDRGRMLDVGTVDELIKRHGGRPSVVIERARGEERIETDKPLAEIERVLAAEDRALGVRVERANLETVFLNLTGRKLRD
jgi:ABC-2 type transport system ATP-binding protein